MTADEALAQLAVQVGVLPEFKDMQGVLHQTTPPTQRAFLRANGFAADTGAEVSETYAALKAQVQRQYLKPDLVVETGLASQTGLAAPAQWQVLSEADNAVLAEGQADHILDLPPLPDGVHRLCLTGARGPQEVCLICAPVRVPRLRDMGCPEKTWGIMAALYGLRGTDHKELADYADLAACVAGLAGTGASFFGINPVHALGIAAIDTISPYSPTHRGFLNTDYVALSYANKPVQPRDLLDYAAHRDAHGPALKAAYERFVHSASTVEHAIFDTFCQAGGSRLGDFARFETLSETYGSDSRKWPSASENSEPLDPDGTAFHKWLQWQADVQMAAAQRGATTSGMSLGLYLDLAVGARVGGAESWGHAAATAPGVTLGAPPDHLSPAGQDWQLAASSPYKAQATCYDAFRFVLRQNMRHAGVLRIDHALGMNRSFWLPEDGSPGAYMKQPFQSLMAIIAIEATRAGTVIVGEDLGLVPPGFRAEMSERGLYGYSVLQYEKDAGGRFLPSEGLRSQSLACFGTHDTPTLAGFWHGEDIAWWEKLGWIDATEAARVTDTRFAEKRQLAAMPAPDPLPRKATSGIRDTIHTRLAESPAALVAVQLDDVLGVRDAQNLPGTIQEHPNWRRVYPETISEMINSPDLQKTANIMAHAGRNALKRKDAS